MSSVEKKRRLGGWFVAAALALAAPATVGNAADGPTPADPPASAPAASGPAATEPAPDLDDVAGLYDRISANFYSPSISELALWAPLFAALNQTGFALWEIGSTASRLPRRAFGRNYLIYPLAAVAFWVYGFAFGWGNWFNGPVQPGFLATLGPGLSVLDRGVGIAEDPTAPGVFRFGLLDKGFCLSGVDGPSVLPLFFLMLNFMIVVATIPVVRAADRWRWKSFLLYGCWVALPFSIYANWAWAGGWLAQSGLNWQLGHGVVDFAGSGVVFALGGLIALAGCVALGLRGGGAANEPSLGGGRNLRAIAIGAAMLVFQGECTRLEAAIRAPTVNGLLSMFCGALGALTLLKLRRQPIDLVGICQGLLAGSVASAGSCALVDGFGAAVIGLVAGLVCPLSISFWNRLRVDDTTGAISIFGASGLWGLIAVGLFANGRYGEGWNGVFRPDFVERYGADGVRGLFYGDPSQLAAQLLAAAVLLLVGFSLAFACFRLSNLVEKSRANDAAAV